MNDDKTPLDGELDTTAIEAQPVGEPPAAEVAGDAEATSDDTPRAEQASDDAAGDDENDANLDEGDAPVSHGSKKRAALENEGEIAADYLEELLDIADLDGDIDTYVEGGRARVSVLTDSELLVGKDGEVLDALQELCRLAVMTQNGKRSRLMLDIAGYRDKRRQDLEALATDAVVEVQESGESVRLTPMNPFERKIVHDVVAKAGLRSESEGAEPQRRVIVLPAEA